MRRFVPIALAALICTGGCSGRNGGSAAKLGAPTSAASLEALEAIDRDCLQYPVDTLSDGVVVWHADYVYFYLVEEKSGRLALGRDGAPIASGLLHSQTVPLLQAAPIPGTAWTCRVKRLVRQVKGPRVVRQDPIVVVDDVDLKELLDKDWKARFVALQR